MNDTLFPLNGSTYNIADFLRTLFRHRWKVLLVPLAILSLASLVILFAPREYRSEAKLFMQVGRESVKLDPTATTGDTISMQTTDRNNEIITVIDTLRSRGLIEKVVDTLGPEVVLAETGVGEEQSNILVNALKSSAGAVINLIKSIDPVSDREEAVIAIERNLNVEAENDSTLITVQFDAETPELAQLIAQSLVDIYREEHLRLHRTSGSKEFFAEQHEALKKQLDDSVIKLGMARNRMNMVSIESRRDTLESRMANIELSLYDNLRQLAATRARVADLRKQLAATPERVVSSETTVPNTGTDLLRDQVFELQVLMLDLQAKYSDDHPMLKTTREQLKTAEAKLNEESDNRQQTTNDINPNHRALALTLAQEESQLAGIVAQNNKLSEQRATVVEDLKEINNFELEVDRLKRESQLARNNFFRYAGNFEEGRIDEALDKERISNVIEYQKATLAEKPVSPSKMLIAALSVMLSCFSVISLVLVSEKMSSPIYKSEQLEDSLQLPVFGLIPEQKSPHATTA